MGLFGGLFKPAERIQPTMVDDGSFGAEVLKSDKPVIVDFYSPSCAPCRKLVPVLSDIATAYPDDVKVVMMEVGQSRQTAGRFGVRATPTVLVFDGGKEMGRVVGFRPKSWFRGMIETEFLEK